MITNPFNLCTKCMHLHTCVLTEQKEKVWSCSEHEEAPPEPITIVQKAPKSQLELV